MIDKETMTLLENKLVEMEHESHVRSTMPNQVPADSLWPFNLDFDKMNKSTWMLAVSKYQTALMALDALQHEVVVQTVVIQNLMSQQ